MPNCLICENSLEGRRANARYCSPACEAKAWRRANPQKRHEYYIRFMYNLEPEQYDAMIVAQSGRCAICLREFGGALHICVDHDHDDGRVRGLLCDDCNAGLGRFRDEAETLRRAADYLA